MWNYERQVHRVCIWRCRADSHECRPDCPHHTLRFKQNESFPKSDSGERPRGNDSYTCWDARTHTHTGQSKLEVTQIIHLYIYTAHGHTISKLKMGRLQLHLHNNDHKLKKCEPTLSKYIKSGEYTVVLHEFSENSLNDCGKLWNKHEKYLGRFLLFVSISFRVPPEHVNTMKTNNNYLWPPQPDQLCITSHVWCFTSLYIVSVADSHILQQKPDAACKKIFSALFVCHFDYL